MTEEVRIRPLQAADVGDLYELWRHPAVARTTLGIPSQEFSWAVDRVENPPKGLHRLVAEVDGRVVGSIGLRQAQNPRLAHTGDLGMMVHPDYWGQGIGAQLMRAAVDLADNWLNLKRIELTVNTDNPAAVHLYQKFGFVIEGAKRYHTYGDGRWADSHFMARIRE